MRPLPLLVALLFLLVPASAQDEAEPTPGTPSNQGPDPVIREPAPTQDEARYPDYVRPVAPCQDQAPDASPSAQSEPQPVMPSETLQPASGQVSHAELPGGGDEVTVAPGQDQARFWYDSTHGRLRFAYHASPDAPARALELQLHGVDEYDDADANGVLDEGELVYESFRVDDPLTHFPRTVEDACGFRLRWTYLLRVSAEELNTMPEDRQRAFLEDQARLTFQFTHWAGRDGDTAPERVKIDFGIDDFPFEADRPHSKLALHASVYSLDRLVHRAGDADGPPRLEGADGDARIGFTWEPTATVDGATVDVPVVVEERDPRQGITMAVSAFRLVFHYPHADHVWHDPELGLLARGIAAGVAGIAEGHILGYAAGAAAAAAVLVTLTATRRRLP